MQVNSFLLSLSVVFSLYFFFVTFQLFQIISLVVNKDVPISIVLELLLHIATSFFPLAIPLAALFSSIYTLNKLSTDSEFIMMRAIGLSQWQLYRPFLLSSFVIAIMCFALGQTIVPNSKKNFKKIVAILTSKGVLANIQKGQFFTEIPYVTIFAKDVEEKGKKLHQLFVHTRGDHFVEQNVIHAELGILRKNKQSKWGGGELRLHLYNGKYLEILSG